MEFNHSPSVDKILNENCCFFCRETTLFRKQCHGFWSNDYYCPHCGYYRITEDVIYNLHDCYKFRVWGTALAQERKLTGQDNYILQWCDIQENDNEHQICMGNVPFLNSYPKDYLEKLDRILLNIGRKTDNSPLNYFQPDYHDFGLFFVEPQIEY